MNNLSVINEKDVIEMNVVVNKDIDRSSASASDASNNDSGILTASASSSIDLTTGKGMYSYSLLKRCPIIQFTALNRKESTFVALGNGGQASCNISAISPNKATDTVNSEDGTI